MADFITYIQDVANRSDELRKTLVDPFRMEDGTFLIPKLKLKPKSVTVSLKVQPKIPCLKWQAKARP